MQPAQRRNFGLMCPGLALLRARVGINSAHLLHSSSTCSALIEQPRIGPAAVALLSSRSSDLLPQANGVGEMLGRSWTEAISAGEGGFNSLRRRLNEDQAHRARHDERGAGVASVQALRGRCSRRGAL